MKDREYSIIDGVPAFDDGVDGKQSAPERPHGTTSAVLPQSEYTLLQ